MSRPLRVEFGGALYHVTSRGDRREAIFEDDDDRRALLGVVAQAMMDRFDGEVLAYYLMGISRRRRELRSQVHEP